MENIPRLRMCTLYMSVGFACCKYSSNFCMYDLSDIERIIILLQSNSLIYLFIFRCSDIRCMFILNIQLIRFYHLL